ncbi:MAG: Hpt domain-containing protein [Planctomycetota bacterium]|nr:MAG: Hpt domain-containing protein [Planctomycetota bacterium]
MSTALPPLNQEKLEELLEIFGDADELSELFEEYFAELPERLQELRDALSVGDSSPVNQIAHTLKGSSGNLGASAVQEVARGIEEQAKAGTLEQVGGLLDQLDIELERLRQALERQSLL